MPLAPGAAGGKKHKTVPVPFGRSVVVANVSSWLYFLQDEDNGVPSAPAALLGGASPSGEEQQLWQAERLR